MLQAEQIRQLASSDLRCGAHGRRANLPFVQRTGRMTPAMASGPNPDLHVWRGDWFGPFVHVFELS